MKITSLFILFLVLHGLIGLFFCLYLVLKMYYLPKFMRIRAWIHKHMKFMIPQQPRFFILDSNSQPIPVKTEDSWIAWLSENHERRSVSCYQTCCTTTNPDEKNTVTISTVFLGVDHNFRGYGLPLLYETIVEGGLLDGERVLSPSLEEAVAVHHWVLKTHKALDHAVLFCQTKGIQNGQNSKTGDV